MRDRIILRIASVRITMTLIHGMLQQWAIFWTDVSIWGIPFLGRQRGIILRQNGKELQMRTNCLSFTIHMKLSLIRKHMIKRREWEKGYLQGETVKSLRTGCQDFFIVRIVEADWHISIQSQKMGKYMTAIRHSGVAGTTINIIHVLVTISRQAQ